MARVMTPQPGPDLEPAIQRLLQQRGKDYLTIRQLVMGLPAGVRQQLGLTRAQTTTELLKRLTPCLGERLQVYRSAATVYIGPRQSPAELLLRKVQQTPGISPKKLALGLPLVKKDYLAALNALLEAGTVICTFKDNHMPVLHSVRHPSSMDIVQVNEGNEPAALQAAYRDVGQGRSFVRIHRLRDALPWPRERFDRVLQALVADYTVELHGGDPSVMTAEELRQSFTAADGTLYIALSWRGTT